MLRLKNTGQPIRFSFLKAVKSIFFAMTRIKKMEKTILTPVNS
jgi:hypothetical protein